MSQLNQQLIDSLACPICLGTFQGTPLVLQCGHSFCAICIDELKRSLGRNQSHKCPVCRKFVYFNNAQKNYALQSVLDSVNAIPSDSSQAGDTVGFIRDTMYHQLQRQLVQLREQRAELLRQRAELRGQQNELRFQRDQLQRQRDAAKNSAKVLTEKLAEAQIYLLISNLTICFIAILGILIFWKFYVLCA